MLVEYMKQKLQLFCYIYSNIRERKKEILNRFRNSHQNIFFSLRLVSLSASMGRMFYSIFFIHILFEFKRNRSKLPEPQKQLCFVCVVKTKGKLKYQRPRSEEKKNPMQATCRTIKESLLFSFAYYISPALILLPFGCN